MRKLEEKVRGLEAALEERGQELHDERARAIAEADAARMEAMQVREEQLTGMLTQAQASLAAMQKLYAGTQSQLLAIQSQSEEVQWGRQSELELASAELDRAQQRLASLELEKANLVQQLSTQHASIGSGGGARASADGGIGTAHGAVSSHNHHSHSLEDSLRGELNTQREMASRLRLELLSARRDAEEAGSMWGARVEGLRATLLATEAHAAALEQELAARPTLTQV